MNVNAMTRFPTTQNAPGRRFIVSDPSKLSYFARAGAVRAGVANTWGSLQGFNEAMPDHAVEGANNVQAAGSLQTIGDFFGQIGRNLLGSTPSTPVVQQTPPPDMTGMHVAIGLGAAALGGFLVWKLVK